MEDTKEVSNRQDPDGAVTTVFSLLGILGAFSLAVPYVAPRLGADVGVSSSVEIVDHVLPGAVIVVAAAVVTIGRPPPTEKGTVAVVVCSVLCLLAGLWITFTHAPLVVDAFEGLVSPGAAVFHAIAGPLVALLSLRGLLTSTADESRS